jgi:hypothetical protein
MNACEVASDILGEAIISAKRAKDEMIKQADFTYRLAISQAVSNYKAAVAIALAKATGGGDVDIAP